MIRTHSHNPASGFTLIEVIVALLIMSILGAVLLSIITTVSHSWHASQERGEKLRQLQRVFLAGWYDFSQVSQLPPPVALFASSPFILDETGGVYILRSGWINDFNEQRSQLQYVHYLSEGKDPALRRHTAPIALLAGIDNLTAIDTSPQSTMRMLASNTTLRVTVVDQDSAVYTQWPPLHKPDNVTPRLLNLHIGMPPFGDVEAHIPLLSLLDTANAPPKLPAR